jgi:tRNA threonylcarbamoyladenosine modification (KEOPS) complex Cgi121 subunit
MNKSGIRFAVIVAVVVFSNSRGISQTVFTEILVKGTFKEQMNYLEEKTRIYEDYRAIREDIFQKIKNNAIDSLTKAKDKISGFVSLTGNLNIRIDSLNSRLNTTKMELAETSRTKNAISILGIKLDKTVYNTIMWIIVAGLAFLLVIGFLAFKRNRTITLTTKKELNELREEFEAYRKKTRLDREKMGMDHFKEIQKLKGI